MRRTIHLPAVDKRVTLGAYVRAVRKAIAHPDVEFPHSLEGWWPATGAEIRRQFRKGMQERISAGIPYSLRD